MNQKLALNEHCLFIFFFLFELSTANLRRQTHLVFPSSAGWTVSLVQNNFVVLKEAEMSFPIRAEKISKR